MTEAELQAHIIDKALKLGVLVGVTPDSRRAFSGEPDLRLAGRRGVLWAEVKDDQGELSSAQRRWRWTLQASGQKWVLLRPGDWDNGTVTRLLEGIA